MNFASFVGSPPALHSWDEGKTWNTGGFESHHLQAIFDFCRQHLRPRPNIIETGAGNSTICFLHLEPNRLVTIAPDKELFERIDAYCRVHGVTTPALDRHIEKSEWVLPELAKGVRRSEPIYDLALIDGDHNWPTVMIDFFYINVMLKKGAFLMIDDVHLHPIAELFRYLSYDRTNFQLKLDLGKLQVFQKVTDKHETDDWMLHPYVKALSGRAGRPLRHYARFVMWATAVKRKWLHNNKSSPASERDGL